MKIYVCSMTHGYYDEAYKYAQIAFTDEPTAKEWVARKEEGLTKLYKLEEHYIENVPQADHWLKHKIPPRNEHEKTVVSNFYSEQKKILQEYGLEDDQHTPEKEEVELVE